MLMLSKVISLFLLIILFFSQSEGKVNCNEKSLCILLFDSSSNMIKSGYVYLLSNDLIVNDISLCEWDNLEKQGYNKIPKNGIYKIPYTMIKMYNQIGADSISIIYRCDKGLGTWYRVPINIDTIRVYNVEICMKNRE